MHGKTLAIRRGAVGTVIENVIKVRDAELHASPLDGIRNLWDQLKEIYF